MKNKILITGADGFIGSHLSEELVLRNYNVKALAQYNSFNNNGWLDHCKKDIKSSLEIVSGDIRDSHFIRTIMQDCSSVIHLASLIAIPYSYYSPQSYIDTNINGTLNILNAGRDFNVERIIHTSTSEVYGSAKYIPIDEEHPLVGQSPYSASKIGADQLAISFYKSYNLPLNIIRPFNTFGPRQSARAVIPTTITQIASGIKCINLGSLSPTRDFSYIDDTVSGFISSLNLKKFGETINLGSGFEISIEKTVQIISYLMNAEITVKQDKNRIRPKNSEVDRLFSNNSKAKKLLSWKPDFSGEKGFKEGLRKTIDWFQDKENLKFYKSNEYNI